jgi:hypothetical protein
VDTPRSEVVRRLYLPRVGHFVYYRVRGTFNLRVGPPQHTDLRRKALKIMPCRTLKALFLGVKR